VLLCLFLISLELPTSVYCSFVSITLDHEEILEDGVVVVCGYPL